MDYHPDTETAPDPVTIPRAAPAAFPNRLAPLSLSSEFSRMHFAGQLFFLSSTLVLSNLSLFLREVLFSVRISFESPKKPSKKPEKPLSKNLSYLISIPSHCAVCGRYSLSRLLPRSRLVRVLEALLLSISVNPHGLHLHTGCSWAMTCLHWAGQFR